MATSTNQIRLPRAKAAKAPRPSSSVPPLGKFLSSNDKPVRDKAVAALARFFAGATKKLNEDGSPVEDVLEVGSLDWTQEWVVDDRLAPFEMAKLWKGIFYCFWMSDKPLVQQALANDLANLLLEVRPGKKNTSGKGRVARFRSALAYLKGFWEAVVREWAGLDRLRLDKFYLLIRRFVGAAFKLLAREEWDLTAIAEYNECLAGPGGPLHVLDTRIPHSLAYHLGDIYLDELERMLPEDPASPLRVVPLVPLLQPFLTTLARAPSSAMFLRLTLNLFNPLFDFSVPLPQPKSKRRKVASEIVPPEYPRIFAQCQVEGMDGTEDGPNGKRLCGEGALAALFAEGSKTDTNEVNRRRIYKLWREKSGEEETESL